MVVPGVWAFLPDKKAVTYMKLWEVLAKKVVIRPSHAVFDMERAAFRTFMPAYLLTKVSYEERLLCGSVVVCPCKKKTPSLGSSTLFPLLQSLL